jgi:hypothetical protein
MMFVGACVGAGVGDFAFCMVWPLLIANQVSMGFISRSNCAA